MSGLYKIQGGLHPVTKCLQDPTGEAAAEAQKNLVLYELDLGLNHVKRKSAEPIDNGANLLIPVPATSPTPKPTDQPFSYGPGKLLLAAMRMLSMTGL